MNNFDSNNIRLIIAHTLKVLGRYCAASENLLMTTINLQDKYRAESPEHGLGLYKIDRTTHLNIWDKYLAFDPDLASTVRGLASQQAFLQDPHLELLTNLSYATAIAWLVYQRNNITLPHAEDLSGLNACWEKYFATEPYAEQSKRARRPSRAKIITWRPRPREALLQA